MKPTPNDHLTRFIVLFEGRSGSTYFVEALDSHPQIRAEKELLAPLTKKIERGRAEPADQLERVKRLYLPGDHDHDVTGFKAKPKDIMDREGLARILRDNDVRVILLQRRNRIKHLVSLVNAMQLNEATGDWNLYRESDRQPMLRLDIDYCRNLLRKLESGNRILNTYARGLGLPTLEVYYEELLGEGEETFRRVCDFLSVPYRPLHADCKKNTSDDLREAVENFDEFRGAFAGTPYESMFDEVIRVEG